MFKNWKCYERFYYIGSMALLIGLSLIYHSAFLSLLAALTGITAVMFNMKAQKICFVMYLIQCFIYTYIAYQEKFYGEVIRNVFFSIPVYLWSIIQWIRATHEVEKETIFTISSRAFIFFIIIIAAGTMAYGYGLSLFGTAQPYLNSLATLLVMTGTYMAGQSIKQQWYLWTVYCVVMFAMWYTTIIVNGPTQLPLLIQNILFFGLNVQGIFTWERLAKQQGERLLY
ncbi:MAG: nicotinamide riboside transporter PnuC [Erysipelotrichaceae bacterium]|nr:nicotinamide riboside transporter PnuC [Erysipelotrichaceae bacterium]